VVGEDPTDLDIVIQLGHAHKENGDYDHAAQAYYSALSKKSGDYDLCLQIGHLEKLRNNFVEAVRFYKAAEILNPNNVDARQEHDALILQLVKNRAAAVVERDAALGERDTADAARDSALSERNSAILVCDAAIQERDAAQQGLETAQRERDDLVNTLLAKMLEGAKPPPAGGSAASPRWQWDKASFVNQLPSKGTLLDVGCGSNSPFWTKQRLPDWYYVGLDIGDYNQTQSNLADKYILTTPEEFCKEIEHLHGQLDAIISSHNLEHCFERSRVLIAMAQALKSGGRMYLSFPCQESVQFPGRAGTLNYYDDSSHRDMPPDFGHVISDLHREGLRVLYAATRYQPPVDWIYGLKHEEESAKAKVVKHGTWLYWGFETVIWAEKL